MMLNKVRALFRPKPKPEKIRLRIRDGRLIGVSIPATDIRRLAMIRQSIFCYEVKLNGRPEYGLGGYKPMLCDQL